MKLALLALLTGTFLLGELCVQAEPKPILMVSEQPGWGGLDAGPNTPVLVVYDDDIVIFQGEKPTLKDPFHRCEVESGRALVKKLVGRDLARADPHYTLSTSTDQLTSVIWTPRQSVSVYGDWRRPSVVEGHPEWAEINKEHQKRWAAFPKGVRQVLARVEAQRKVLKGKPWIPPTIEVMFWPNSHHPETTITWPDYWPGIHDKTSKQTGTDQYSVFLSSKSLPELERRAKYDAVVIEDQKYWCRLRFVFPGEEAWRN